MQPLYEKIWYGRHPAAALLDPLGIVFRILVAIRRAAFQRGLLSSYRADVAVIVVGNLTVGGTGKTPLVIWLVN